MFLLVAVGAFVITLYVSPTGESGGDQITIPADRHPFGTDGIGRSHQCCGATKAGGSGCIADR